MKPLRYDYRQLRDRIHRTLQGRDWTPALSDDVCWWLYIVAHGRSEEFLGSLPDDEAREDVGVLLDHLKSTWSREVALLVHASQWQILRFVQAGLSLDDAIDMANRALERDFLSLPTGSLR